MTPEIEIAKDGLPDFTKHGFHLGKMVHVRYADGMEALVYYQGYGMFGKDNREDVTHWKESA